MSLIGQTLDRTDGPQKVSGHARYAAEHTLPRMAHAVMVTSTIASGSIETIDTSVAADMPGVLLVLTHRNAPRLPDGGQGGAHSPPAGRILNLLQDEQVHYNRQPVAVVVADTLEQAQDAASHLRIRYREQAPKLDFAQARQHPHKPDAVKDSGADSARGDFAAGMQAGARRFDAVYGTPTENHNPMEPHATLAAWDGDRLTLYDSTQYISGVRNTIAKTFGIDPSQVHVICPFVGGGFGCKGSVWSHVALAAMAARKCGRPVRLALERPQMFGPVGARPRTEQHLQMAAADDGKLLALRHDVVSSTSMIEDWVESSALLTRMLYATPNQQTTHRLAALNIGTPTFMRAPGESSGSFALESAMDELAHELDIDPIQLRLQNYATSDPDKNLPWSSKSLRECYRVGAERFGWNRRSPQPRSMRADGKLVGMGMATATYPALRQGASASARVLPDGSAVVRSGSQDLGTGTYTVMTQVAADALGIAPGKLRFELGDTDYPQAPVSGGSQTVASVAPAVRAACDAARVKLLRMAIADGA